MQKKFIISVFAFFLFSILSIPLVFASSDTEISASVQEENEQLQHQQQEIQEQVTERLNLGRDLYATVRDDGGYLSVADRRNVEATLKQIEKEHKIRCALIFTQEVEGEIKDYAKYLVSEYYYDGEKGSIVLVIDMSQHRYHISMDKKMKENIILEGDNRGVGKIKDEIEPFLKEGNVADASIAYAIAVEELMHYREHNGKPYNPMEKFDSMAAIMATILAGLIAWEVRKRLVASMSNVLPAMEAEEYLDSSSIQINKKEDIFLYTVTVVDQDDDDD